MIDSKLETLKHSRRVDQLILEVLKNTSERLTKHDLSKMEDPELKTFNQYTSHFPFVEYGSEEYKQNLIEMKAALNHHYANNRHHPEHFPNGIDGMTFIDLIEMLADWKASTERHTTGSLNDSLRYQKIRFNISDQLFNILVNTAVELDWM